MATTAGSEGKVLVGSDQVAEIKSWSLEITSDTVDASIIGTSWRKNQATIKSWSGSFEGFWDDTDTLGQGALTVGSTVTLNLHPEGNDTGDTFWTGDVIITSISYNASFDGIVEASFSFTGNGALTESTVP
ncbi:MAG: phage tail protein [Alphaproteobacteria bacterium]|nr:phage tail protein [Alphaproteobacteria bacterium]